MLLLLGVVAVVVFTILNLRDGRGHASVPDEHQRKGICHSRTNWPNDVMSEWI